MRALPVNPVPDMPDFMLGLSMIRGAPVPVLDTARLMGTMAPLHQSQAAIPARYVALAIGERSVALAVDDVIGVRTVAAEELSSIAPLLDAVDEGVVQAISTLDRELLLILRAGRLVPEAMWSAMANAAERP